LCVTSRARNITGIFFALAKRIVWIPNVGTA
jgi:hypothetical protein